MRKIAVLALVIFVFLVGVPTLYMTFIGPGNVQSFVVTNGEQKYTWSGNFKNANSTQTPVTLKTTSVSSNFVEGNLQASNLTVMVSGNGFNTSTGITLVFNVTVKASIYGAHLPKNLTIDVSGGNYSKFQSNFVEFALEKYTYSKIKLLFTQSSTTGTLPYTPVALTSNVEPNATTSQKNTSPVTFTVNSLIYIVVSTHNLSPFNLDIKTGLNGFSSPVFADYNLLISQSV